MSEQQHGTDRRTVLVSGSCMAGGLVASYGTLAWMAGNFLYPVEDDSVGWQFVANVNEIEEGKSLEYESPAGVKVVIARQAAINTAESFIALSSICPHLGCQVHWEPQRDRFFCPCHNGAFDAKGQPTEGPPADANQQLIRFRLKVESELLYVLAPLHAVGGKA